MQTIAVLGANGRLASQVAMAFHDKGYRVLAVTRSGAAAGLPAGIEQRTADAMDRRALTAATEGADIIFNGLNPTYTQWRRYVLPMGENVIAAARQHGALHLFPGNVYNYGHEVHPGMRPQDPQGATTSKGRIRIALEQLFEREAQRGNVRTIILRAGDFFGGPVKGSWFDLSIAAKIDKGIFTYPGPMDLAHSWAYTPDLAATFVALADRAGELGPFEMFNFPDHTLTGQQLMDCCEQAVGLPLKRAGIPWPLLRAAGLFSPMMRHVCEMSYLWHVPHSLDGDKLRTLLGTVPHTDADSAVSAALSDLGINRNASPKSAAVAAA
ncbi:NmrA family NAD(P)-binding protein [Hoeflea poritis]|uniref:NmrA family NAD(P)-binding protein n=1 Tax=Hoeflea poritis TaxID=2993659 RepID=A0ABT4VLU9_9HYPH|nr:NmrA family NAD(P)-binding protein [Hoeflea poritis]MDA4845654.1 NmrA family NAD(P)-binding protein [Hoeflea poritis]